MEVVEVFADIPDYSSELSTIIDKLENLNELQVLSINNSVENLNVLFIFVGLFIGVLLGALFVKITFR